MTTMFLIIRVDFDSMENHAPLVERPVGVTGDRDLADALVAKYTAAREPYKGWGSDKLYPTFHVVEVPHLVIKHRDHDCAWPGRGHREVRDVQTYVTTFTCIACGRVRCESSNRRPGT